MSLPVLARTALLALAGVVLAGQVNAGPSADAGFAAVAGEGDLVAQADTAAANEGRVETPAPRPEGAVSTSSRTRPVGPEKMIEELITTARKRNEAVQSTPVAVTAF